MNAAIAIWMISLLVPPQGTIHETGIPISPNGYWLTTDGAKLIVADAREGKVYGLDESLQVVWKQSVFEKRPSEILGMRILPDDRLALARKHVLESAEIVLMDLRSFEKEVTAFPVSDDPNPQFCQLVVFSPDGSYLCPRFAVFDVENQYRLYSQRLFRKDQTSPTVLAEQGANHFFYTTPNREQWLSFLRESCLASLQERASASFLPSGELALVRGSVLSRYDPSQKQETPIANLELPPSKPWEPVVQLWVDRLRFPNPEPIDKVISDADLDTLASELRDQVPEVRTVWQLLALGPDRVGVVDCWTPGRQSMSIYRLGDGEYLGNWSGARGDLFWDDLAPSAVWADGYLYSPNASSGELIVKKYEL